MACYSDLGGQQLEFRASARGMSLTIPDLDLQSTKRMDYMYLLCRDRVHYSECFDILERCPGDVGADFGTVSKCASGR